jgi:hypothetical protein
MIFTFEAMVDAVLGAGQVEGMAAKTQWLASIR